MSLSPIKVAQFCFPANNWVTHFGNETHWHGWHNFVLKSLEPKLSGVEMVHDYAIEARFPLKNLKAIQAGEVDVDFSLFGVNWERYQNVDFASPWSTTNIVIMSRKMIKRDVFEGTFDRMSIILMISSLVVLWWMVLLFGRVGSSQ